MTTTPASIMHSAEETMQKATEYLKNELRGLRTGRATPALVEFLKVEYYGSQTDLKSLAAISVPEPTQLLIKPFDAAAVSAIKHAIEVAQLGLNPMVEAKQIRLNIPALSADRRKQLETRARKMGEEQKVAIRNVRRDANKHAEILSKDTAGHVTEDQLKELKENIQKLLKKFEDEIDKRVEEKCKEIMTV